MSNTHVFTNICIVPGDRDLFKPPARTNTYVPNLGVYGSSAAKTMCLWRSQHGLCSLIYGVK